MSIFTHNCNCMGPQNGEPVCPCQMRSVKIIDGRYVMIRDLGPVSDKSIPLDSLKDINIFKKVKE